MRSTLRWALAAVVFISACSGGSGGNPASAPRDTSCQGETCENDDPDNPALPPANPLRCDGIAAATCPEGYRCVDDAADDCDPATGTDCGGICVLGEPLPGCGASEEPCPPGSVCVSDTNDACDDAANCPGHCEPRALGDCVDDEDCPAMPAMCRVCPDGSATCPNPRCDAEGKCTVDVPACPESPRCGGLDGVGCAPGFHCVDDPADDCSWADNAADCSGICVPGEDPLRCGGLNGPSCPPGLTCIDATEDGCDAGIAADCPGMCVPDTEVNCNDDADCPILPVPCAICADGSQICARTSCQNGKCVASSPPCGSTLVCGDDDSGCGVDEMCLPDPDAPCDPATNDRVCRGKCVPIDRPRECGDGGNANCPPGYICVSPDGVACDPNAAGEGCGGKCVPSGTTECRDDAECPVVLAPCVPCGDGTFACPKAFCLNGTCGIMVDACPTDPGFCGGIAGFPCPPGMTCVDNPNDECDPQRGGADCAGMCVREEQPESCNGFPGTQCPPGYECADVPDDCDPATGGADCRGVCRPAPYPTCNSDADCVVVGAPCLICADGTAACPEVSCVNGQCQADFKLCGTGVTGTWGR